MEGNDCYKFSTIRRFLDRTGQQPVRTALDIGANIGAMSREIRRYFPEARIFAFEPVREYYETCHRKLAQDDRIHVLQAAVSGAHLFEDDLGRQPRPSPVPLQIFKARPESGCGWIGGSHVHPWGADHLPVERYEPLSSDLRALSLDEAVELACREAGVSEIDYVKMDCEGSECSALGCASLETLRRIRFISGEYHELNDFYEVLAGKLYQTHRVNLVGEGWGSFFCERIDEGPSILEPSRTDLAMRSWMCQKPVDWYPFRDEFVAPEERLVHGLEARTKVVDHSADKSLEQVAVGSMAAQAPQLEETPNARPRLSLCMIVRDNARTLPACLASIRPWVDEMIVVDTGSLDETPQIAADFGAKVFHFPWCDDFAAARNQSLQHATGNWLFWMDSDDTIPEACGRQIRELADRPLSQSPMAYVMQVHCPGPGDEGGLDVTVVDHVKMFRNLPELRFEGRIHEQVLAPIRRLEGRIEWTDIHVVHSGSEHTSEARRRKQERDLRLIRLELQEHPEHTFHLFNLGMTLADMEDHEPAVDALRRSLAAAAPHESHVRKIYALLVGSLTRLKRYDEAQVACEEGLAIFPDDAELHFRRGIVLQQLKRFEEAVQEYRAALVDRDERHFSSVDQGITSYKARHNLAVVYGEMGRHDLAEIEWRRIVAEVPRYREGWMGLIDVLIQQHRLAAASVMIDSMERIPQLAADVALRRYELAIAEGQESSACQIIKDAVKAFSDDEAVLRAHCRHLFTRQSYRAALASLDNLATRCPEDGSVWHNLGLTQLALGNSALAIPAFCESLRLRPGYQATEVHLAKARQRCIAEGAAS